MNIAFFTYTRKGCAVVRRILTDFDNSDIRAFTMERFCEVDFLPLDTSSDAVYREMFSWADVIVFVSACGIAVRKIAPYIKDKCTDPAVICIDDSAKFVIPLLSGHIGGANELAMKIAKRLNSVCAVTTATDNNNKFAVDTWAVKNGFKISSMSLAKAASAEILERNIPLLCELPVVSDYPNGVEYGENGELGIYIGWEKKIPFERTLHIIPPILHLGIGCRKGISIEAIRSAVDTVLEEYNIDKRAVKCVASIDIKAQEEGLLEFCRENQWEAQFYTADELRSVQGDFTSSEFVKSITGIDNVCERAAMMGAEKLIVKKTAKNGVTVAIAVENTEVRFG